VWLVGGFCWGQRHLRRHVCGRVHRRISGLRRRPDLPDVRASGAAMAAIDQAALAPPALRGLRSTLWAGARVVSIVLLLTAWELVARSGIVTQFQLPALSSVLERIWNDAVSGDLAINTALTLYRAMVGFFIAAVGGIVLGMAMSRSHVAHWFFDPIISVGFPM